MPTPRTELDPRKVFGFGRVPISDYFRVPAGAASNPGFSPATRQQFLQEQTMAREQQNAEREMALEDQANELLDTAAGRTDEGLQDDLLANPRLLATPQAKTIQEWMAARQQAQQPNPKSDEVLGPLFAEKIEDPYLRAQFQERMKSGVSFEGARDQFYDELNDHNQMVKLAEAGVPEEEYAALSDGRRLNPVLVARRIADRQREQSTQKNNLDSQIGLLQKGIDSRKSLLISQGADLVKDPQLAQWNQLLSDLIPQRLAQLSGAGALPSQAEVPLDASGLPVLPPGLTVQPAVTPAVSPTSPTSALPLGTPGQQAFEEILTPLEARQRYEAQQAGNKEQEEINATWTRAKTDVAKQLLEKYPNKDEPYGNPAVLLARSILGNRTVPVRRPVGDIGAALSESTDEDQVPYSIYVLNEIGRDPQEKVFDEPSNKRWGTQAVNNEELLQAWAKDFLTAKGLLQTGEAPVEEIQLSAEDQALLDKYSPKP